MAKENLLGKEIYLEYRNMGGPNAGSFVKLATDKYHIDFMDDSVRNLKFRYFQPPEPLGLDARLRDDISLNKEYGIKGAKRILVINKEIVKDERVHTGRYINNWEDENGELEVDSEAALKMHDLTEQRIAEFTQRFNHRFAKRREKIQALYPIDPERFFNQLSEGIGLVFQEQYAIQNMHSCCNPSLQPGAGFVIDAKTDNYQFIFEYEKHSHNKGRWDWLYASLLISRSNHGFKVSFDQNFDVRRIQATGAFNNMTGEMYTQDDLKEGKAKVIHEISMQLLEQFHSEFALDERMRTADSLTQDELHAAQHIVNYMVNPRENPSIHCEHEHG